MTAELSKEIEAIAHSDETIKRLLTIPGIGPLGATALVAAAGDGKQFKKARDMAAWLGLVPAEHSSGGKQNLLGISKRGNGYGLCCTNRVRDSFRESSVVAAMHE